MNNQRDDSFEEISLLPEEPPKQANNSNNKVTNRQDCLVYEVDTADLRPFIPEEPY